MEALIGQQLGRYTIQDMLGRGGMAAVFLAHDPSMGREVAIKVLPREFAADPMYVERFRREVKTIARLNHPNIVPVHDFGEDSGWTYIVMTYVPGGTLDSLIRKQGNAMSLDLIQSYIEQIGSALDYAHSQGVIHRDFKPSNVLVGDQRNVLLSDFGVAKVSEANIALTGTGLVGTPSYMAPELANKDGLTPLVDIYAAGVTLYEMVTGSAPFEAPTPMGLLMAHLSSPVPTVRSLRPDLPDSIQSVIDRGMAKDPAQRYQSAGEMADDLKSALRGGSVAVRAGPAKEMEPEDFNTLPTLPTPPLPHQTQAEASLPTGGTNVPAQPARSGVNMVLVAGGGLAAVFAVGMIVLVVVVGLLALSNNDNPASPTEPVTNSATETELPAKEPLPTQSGGSFTSNSNGPTLSNDTTDSTLYDITNYTVPDSFGTFSYNGTAKPSAVVDWSNGWCASTHELLVDNWEKLKFEFSLNGNNVPLSEFYDTEDYSAPDFELGPAWCRSYYVAVSDWPDAETILSQSQTILESLDNGFYEYDPGTYTEVFHITIEK